MKNANQIDIQDVTPDMVVRVYSGTEGCMCGCNGKYYDQSTASGCKMVSKVLRSMKAHGESVRHEEHHGCEWFDLSFPETSRVYVLYLTD